ncbi:MAG: hydrogenase maturation protease [Planctomycetaceae bacterium]|nr:hydrogenase maturation protease [Planctomycetaceae bacterium]
MLNKHPRALIIGLGNELRGDDALGRIAARRLRHRVDPDQVDVIDQTAPAPELAVPIAKSSLVIFLDASSDGPVDQVISRQLHAPDWIEAMTHRHDPPALVGLARYLYGHAPPAFVVTFRGRSFDFGDCSLSPQAAVASELVVEAALAIITESQRAEINGFES